MKKIVAILLTLSLACAALVGCGSSASSSSSSASAAAGLPENLEEIMDTILGSFGEGELPELTPAEMLDGHKYLPLNADNGEAYVGTTAFIDGIAADAAINVVPFSVCLLRAENAEKAAALATEVEQKADPRKWICAAAETKMVATVDDMVLLVMTEKATAEKIVANFEALKK